MELVWPSHPYLPSYIAALCTGWSPDTLRKEAAAREELQRIERDADAFIASQVDREARGAPITLPDGSVVPRLPGYRRWLWADDEAARGEDGFCGVINLRWQHGTAALPPHVLGHIGYAVVPWKRGRGHATQALRLLLQEAGHAGLDHVILTTDPDNLASQRVIAANGGRLLERFSKPAALGGGESLRWRIELGH
jgi:predicted acetyltransferase